MSARLKSRTLATEAAVERAAHSIADELRSGDLAPQFVDTEAYGDRVAVFLERTPDAKSETLAVKTLEQYGTLEQLASPDDLLFNNAVSTQYIYLIRPNPELFESRCAQTSFDEGRGCESHQTTFDEGRGAQGRQTTFDGRHILPLPEDTLCRRGKIREGPVGFSNPRTQKIGATVPTCQTRNHKIEQPAQEPGLFTRTRNNVVSGYHDSWFAGIRPLPNRLAAKLIFGENDPNVPQGDPNGEQPPEQPQDGQQPEDGEPQLPPNPFARRVYLADDPRLNGDIYADEYLESAKAVGFKTGAGEKFTYASVREIPDDMLDAFFHHAFFGRSGETLNEAKRRIPHSFTTRAAQCLEEGGPGSGTREGGIRHAKNRAMRKAMLRALVGKGYIWRLKPVRDPDNKKRIIGYVRDETGIHYARDGMAARAHKRWGGQPLGGARDGGPVGEWYNAVFKANEKRYKAHLAHVRRMRKEGGKIQDSILALRDGGGLAENIHDDAVLECLGLLSCRDGQSRFYSMPFTPSPEHRRHGGQHFPPEVLCELCAISGMDARALFSGFGDGDQFCSKMLLTRPSLFSTLAETGSAIRAGADYAMRVAGHQPVAERMVRALAYCGIPNNGILDKAAESLVEEWRLFKSAMGAAGAADLAILRAMQFLAEKRE